MTRAIISTSVDIDTRDTLRMEADRAGINLSQHLRAILERHVYRDTPTPPAEEHVQTEQEEAPQSPPPKTTRTKKKL